MPKPSNIDVMRSWVLNSGLPLENDVERELRLVCPTDATVESERDYQFIVSDENGDSKIRSVDFKWSFAWPCRTTEWDRGPEETAKLTFIVDAKWSSDELWLFTPKRIEPSTLVFPSLLPQINGDVRHEKFRKLEELSRNLFQFNPSSTGRKSGEMKEAARRESLSDYQVQCIQATAKAMEQSALQLGTAGAGGHYSRNIEIFVPVIATNAPLAIVENTISVERAEKTTIESELFVRNDSVTVAPPNIASLYGELIKIRGRITARNVNRLSWCDFKLIPYVTFVRINSLRKLIEEAALNFSKKLS